MAFDYMFDKEKSIRKFFEGYTIKKEWQEQDIPYYTNNALFD